MPNHPEGLRQKDLPQDGSTTPTKHRAIEDLSDASFGMTTKMQKVHRLAELAITEAGREKLKEMESHLRPDTDHSDASSTTAVEVTEPRDILRDNIKNANLNVDTFWEL